MTKQDLMKHSASEVRSSPTLYAEFLRFYEEDGFSLKGCTSCNFTSSYTRWRNQNIREIKREEMGEVSNTFKLKADVKIVFVPIISETITKDSSDELVVKFLTQEGGKYFDKRSKAFFEVLPDELKEGVPEKKTKRKRRTKKEIEAAKQQEAVEIVEEVQEAQD